MNKPIHESETRTVRGLKELLPDRWKLIKLKLVCNIETGFAFPSEAFGDTGTPVIRITDIKDREINLSEIKRVDDQTLKSKPKRPSVNKGDILMAMTGATIGKVGYYNSDKPSYLNQRVCRFIPANIDRGYLWHTLNSEIYKKYIELEAFGGAQANISDSQLLNFPAPLPELEAEQQKIAQFLDYETAKIDALIDEQKRLIELLKEKRQAVISHAVTKGLNPDAPMKDSGVEWLGDVPEYWDVVSLKVFIRLVESGTSVNASDIPASEGELGVLKTSAVYGDELDVNENKTVVSEEESRVSCQLKGNRLIVSRMNTPDLVGATGFSSTTPGNLFLPDRLWQVTLENVEAQFVFMFTLSKSYRSQIKLVCAGASSSMQNIAQEDFKNVKVAVPPLDEQKAIIEEWQKFKSNSNQLTEQAEKAVKLLQERRSALISAAVTGKIDVRDWQQPEDAGSIDSNAAVQMERQDG